jgi:hypothetical protein
MYYEQNVGQNRIIKIANKSSENVTKLKVLMNDSSKSKLHTQRN